MKLYGIFDKLDNYKLLRYSMAPIEDSIINVTLDPVTQTSITVHETCLSGIEYSLEYIGRHYNTETNTFDN